MGISMSKNVSSNSNIINNNNNNNYSHNNDNVANQIEPKSEKLDNRSEQIKNVDIREQIENAENRLSKQWKRRFKMMLCCNSRYSRNKESISDVANIFADFFIDFKVSSSELAAGMVLMSKFQLAQQQWIAQTKQNGIEQFLSNVPIREDTKFLDLSKAEDSHLINDLCYYMNYSLAIFGWPLQMYENPCSLCCIGPHLKCCSNGCAWFKKRNQNVEPVERDEEEDQQRQQHSNADVNNNNNNNSNNDNTQLNQQKQESSPNGQEKKQQVKERKVGVLEDDEFDPIIIEDNCCRCNWASAEFRLEGNHFEIIYITYQSDVSVTPFLVAADHAKQMIVVSVRGSMTMNDVFTDLNGIPDSVPIDNCPNDWKCHRGMVRAAQWVKSKLINERILDRAFNCRRDWNSNEYGLLLCGHSLGAGVAALLGVILRPLYPKLRAYLYSPPGGIMSLPVVEHTREFAYGIILGNDCVARVGQVQFERARYQILLALKNSDRSTGKILAKAMFPKCCFADSYVEYDPDNSIDLLNATDCRPFLFENKEIPFQAAPLIMYVPGKLIHIVRNYGLKMRKSSIVSKKSAHLKEPIYQAIWSDDNSFYDRIIWCDKMFMDHMPNKLRDAMKMLFFQTLPAQRRKGVGDKRVASDLNEVNATTSHQAIYIVHSSNDDNNDQAKDQRDLLEATSKLEREESSADKENINGRAHSVVINNNGVESSDSKLYPHLKQTSQT